MPAAPLDNLDLLRDPDSQVKLSQRVGREWSEINPQPIFNKLIDRRFPERDMRRLSEQDVRDMVTLALEDIGGKVLSGWRTRDRGIQGRRTEWEDCWVIPREQVGRTGD